MPPVMPFLAWPILATTLTSAAPPRPPPPPPRPPPPAAAGSFGVIAAASAAATTALPAGEGHGRSNGLDPEVPARGADPGLDGRRRNRDLADVASRRIGDLELHVRRLVLDKVRQERRLRRVLAVED